MPGAAPTQTTILIGDAAGIAGGVSPDIATPMTIPAAGGAACFPMPRPPTASPGARSPGRCRAVAPNAPALAAGQSLSRSIAPGCATLLESADDTDSSAADFALGAPTPRPSSVAPTETACGAGGGGGGGGGADTDPPETEITKEPKKKSEKTKAKFKFTANEQGSKFECKLDRGKFKGCGSPKTYKNLDPGKHKFSVFATDAAGNVDPSPATYRFKVLGD